MDTHDTDALLRMIETVSPEDTAKLDEIDARVVCYLAGREYQSHGIWKKRLWVWVPAWIQDFPYRQVVNYTRSRDALKAIRPDGHVVMASMCVPSGRFVGYIWKDKKEIRAKCPFLPTEELAELHAILQAIAYERGQS